MGQAKDYAKKLQLQFAYAANGKEIYEINMDGGEGVIAQFPGPDELWQKAFADAPRNDWNNTFDLVPYEDVGGSKGARYYQEIAVNNVMAAVAAGQNRILLTLATGTGKTFIAFQIVWKLFYSRWNLKREATRRPRILFLADRNILADHAFNAFNAFPEDALVRIKPDEIRKRGKVPTNGSIFFTIFQTFMSGGSTSSPTAHKSDELQEVNIQIIKNAYGYTYILECADGSFYTGSTKNLNLRLEQHKNGDGAEYTKNHLPVKLVYYETFYRIDLAFAREKKFKNGARQKK